MENILVINAGSSSIKFCIINTKTEVMSISGLAESIGNPDARVSFKMESGKENIEVAGKDFAEIMKVIFDYLKAKDLLASVGGVGHRVVHGGEFFKDSVLITTEVMNKIDECSKLAPLHNPSNLDGIKATIENLPHLKNVAVFDTAFHQTLPDYAHVYPIPYEYYEKYSVRRYGFHGTSHRYVSGKATELLSLDKSKSSFVSAHLGNGCSLAAIKNGVSIDTTMGLTPSEGLVMGTRAGLVDPALHKFLADNTGMNLDQITDVLNKKSGLLGISGISNDMRLIEAEVAKGNRRAELSIEIFCYQLAKQIGAFMTTLDKCDGLIFTGGIGEKAKMVRKAVLKQLGIFGYKIDEASNDSHGESNNGVISATGSPTAIIIPTNEELMIAVDTLKIVK